MNFAARRSLRAIAGACCHFGSSSVASSSRVVIGNPSTCCVNGQRLYTSTIPLSNVPASSSDIFDPYPDKTDQDLVKSLEQGTDLPEVNDVFRFSSDPLPIDCASAYICLRLRSSFPDIFPNIPIQTLVDVLTSCSQRGFTRVAHHILDDILRLRQDDLPCLRAVLSMQSKTDLELSNDHVMALYQPLHHATQEETTRLSGLAKRRVIRAYIATDDDAAADIVLSLTKDVLNEPRAVTKAAKAPWIACEAIVYLASIEAFPQAVQLLQRMIADALLPVAAVHEMQLVNRSHPNASGIVVVSAIIRSCLEWQWLERTVRMVQTLQADYLDSCDTKVPASTADLIEDVVRTLLVSKDHVDQAGKLLIDISKSPNFPALSQSLVDAFYDRTPGVSAASQMYDALEKSPVPQPSPSPAALAGLCHYFAKVTRSRRSVASLAKHIRSADPAEMLPFRRDFLLHMSTMGLRPQVSELYKLWSQDDRDSTLADSEVMLVLVRAFTSTDKSHSRPYDQELAKAVIENYLRAISAVSITNIAHTSALRLARAFFLVKNESSALKLFDHILLDRSKSINTADVGALIVSISEDRPLAAVELLKRAHRWGVSLDRGTYDATIKRAIKAGEVDLAKSVQAMALDQGLEPVAPALEEAEWLHLMDEAAPRDLVPMSRDLRRTRDNPYHQVSDRATEAMVRKAVNAGEWRVAVEVWRTRLRPRSGEVLSPREETVTLIHPVVEGLESITKEGGGKGVAAEISAIRGILYDQEPSAARDELVKRCLAMLAILGIKAK